VDCKSTALKLTGIAFITCCPPSIYAQLVTEFEQTLSLLAAVHTRTLKHVVWEAGRGIWGIPCPLCAPACLALQESEFLTSAAEKVPMYLPRCLWQLLPPDLQRMVAKSQGIDVEDAETGGAVPRPSPCVEIPEVDARPLPPDRHQSDGASARDSSALGTARRTSVSPHAVPSAGASLLEPCPQPGVGPRFNSQAILDSGSDLAARAGDNGGAASISNRYISSPDGRGAVELNRLDADVQQVLQRDMMLTAGGAQGSIAGDERTVAEDKSAIRVQRSVVDQVQAVLALQQLHNVSGPEHTVWWYDQ